jgi:hypothetical protein
MKTFCWVVTIIACILAGIQMFDTLLRAESAPQQAAGAAIAATIVIIPYVFSRAVSEIANNSNESKKQYTKEELKAMAYDAIEQAKK